MLKAGTILALAWEWMSGLQRTSHPRRESTSLSLTIHRSCRIQSRFAKPVDESVLQVAAKGVIPLKTEQSTQWVVKNRAVASERLKPLTSTKRCSFLGVGYKQRQVSAAVEDVGFPGHKGAIKQSAKFKDEGHEIVFWEKHLLGYGKPKILDKKYVLVPHAKRYSVYSLGLHFALRGVQEQYNLMPEHFCRVPLDTKASV